MNLFFSHFVCVCFQYIASSWNHDGDPVELLRISDSVAKFRKALKENPGFLQDKVKHYFKVDETSTVLNVCVCVCLYSCKSIAEEKRDNMQQSGIYIYIC